jgi:hypothetical protein
MRPFSSVYRRPQSRTDMLTLYIHQHEIADRSLAVERDITIKNYLALGAVLLVQAGFFTTALKPYAVFVACGIVILTISLAARAMVIFYGKYTSRLFMIASVYRKTYLRDRGNAYLLRKMEALYDSERLPDAENLSVFEFLTYPGALAAINTVPACLGLILTVIGAVTWSHDPMPWSFLK